MRTLTINEMQVVSGGTDLPPPVFVYTTDDMINALTSVPFPVGGYEAA